MGKYLAILDRSVERGTCDKSDISRKLRCSCVHATTGRLWSLKSL